ncbi:uncharacterized protein LOC135351229 [Halichondria panicea]|uniref:uncharacterized protein LOC135351229 n=1 Tax=Halichondria panicea TaxID=6063 RepID=UPI00312BC719
MINTSQQFCVQNFMIMDKIISHSNAAYGLESRVEDENVYELIQPTEEDFNPATDKEVFVKVRVKCYAITTILALLIAVLSLIVALAGVSYASIELSNQQSQLSSSMVCSQELGSGISNPASSCNAIPQYTPSGEYWIVTNRTSCPVRVYCDMNQTSCSCNTTGGWMRVANLDMTDPNQTCPGGFRLMSRTTPPLRTCGRPGPAGCVSTTYPTYGVEYSRVCGRVIGYQDGSPGAFAPYYSNRKLSVDDVYLNGVSLTHGRSPRQHLWTFVNAADETRTRSSRNACPCTRPGLNYNNVPPFIGQDYFCETGSRQTHSINKFYPDDPVWDGQGCGGNSTCCEFNNPPWFCKQLPQPTTDDIELRLCGDENTNNEDTPLEIVEIFVQ